MQEGCIANCHRPVETPPGASAFGGACLSGKQVFTARMRQSNAKIWNARCRRGAGHRMNLVANLQ